MCEAESNDVIEIPKQTERIVVFTLSVKATQTTEECGKQSISLFIIVTEVKSRTKDHILL